MVEAILSEGGVSSRSAFPIESVGRQQGCTRHPDGSVTAPDGFKEAYRQYCEGGWGTTLGGPVEYGGQGMPHFVSMAFEE
jgi:alkylation response protein AidB-like acyl-CoA dehydrogenase